MRDQVLCTIITVAFSQSMTLQDNYLSLAKRLASLALEHISWIYTHVYVCFLRLQTRFICGHVFFLLLLHFVVVVVDN